MKEISAGGLVYRPMPDGTILCLSLHDRFGRLSLPKGKREAGESLEETALREIEEETGITGRVQERLGSVNYSYVSDTGERVEKEAVFYLVRAASERIQAQLEEVQGAEWMELEQLVEQHQERGYENQLEILYKARERLRSSLAYRIDHTLLRADATVEEVDRLCDEAVRHGFYSVCVLPWWVSHCARRLSGSGVKVITVVGFPLGANLPAVKAQEAALAVADGAEEVDVVINIAALKTGQLEVVREELAAIREVTRGKSLMKVILETGALEDGEKRTACRLCREAEADYVKTSTGFGHGGATLPDIRLLKEELGDSLWIKASGGIRDKETAWQMIRAGANRLGTSAGLALI